MSFDEQLYQSTLTKLASHGCGSSISPLGFITEGITCRGRCCIDGMGSFCQENCSESVQLNKQLEELHKIRANYLSSQPDFTGPLNVCFSADDYIKIVQKIWQKQDSSCQHDFRDSEKYEYDCAICHINIFDYRKDDYTYNFEDSIYYWFKEALLSKPEVSRLSDPTYKRSKSSVTCTKCTMQICKSCHLLSDYVVEDTEKAQYYKTLIYDMREKYHILENVSENDIIQAMIKHNGDKESAIKEIPCESEELINWKKMTYKAASDYYDTLIKFEQLFPVVIKHKGNVEDALYEVANKYNWKQYYTNQYKKYRMNLKIRGSVPNYLILALLIKGAEKKDVEGDIKKLPVYNEEEVFYINKMPELYKEYCYTNNNSWWRKAEALIKNKGNLYYSAVDLYDDNDWVSTYRYHLIRNCENYGVKLPEVKDEKELYPRLSKAHGNLDVLMREYMSLEQMMVYHTTKLAEYRNDLSIKESVTDEMMLELIEKNNGDHHLALRDVPKHDDISETNIPVNQPVKIDHEWSGLITNLPNAFTGLKFNFFSENRLKELKTQNQIESDNLHDLWDAYIMSFIEKISFKEAYEKFMKEGNPRSQNAKLLIEKLSKQYPEMILHWNQNDYYAAAQMCPDDEDIIISLVSALFE